MSIDSELKKVEKFISSLKKTDVVELLWEKNGVKIGFKKDDNAVKSNDKNQEKAEEKTGRVEFKVKNGKKELILPDDNYRTIKSRMVGTFYRSPSPGSPVYVKAGEEVKSGQRICMIEAMKVMREISIDENVKIIRILIENGHPVEYNQDMFIVESLKKKR